MPVGKYGDMVTPSGGSLRSNILAIRRHTTEQSITALKNRLRKPKYSPDITPDQKPKK